ncbi:transposase [Thorsellia anophelis]|uniref:Transposase n=5 Tax=Thorsellia anophelis DSM 18579 TaxID=1123402 RepID=A0A1I0D2E2_9GAMM|nr:transposase [Thorsellia anophelis]SET26248.1 transposase [Thorsellia anophelis DSM 18579]
MTDKNRKVRQSFTPKQKNEFAKLIVEDNHSIKHVMEISGASHSAVTRWKSQYLNETAGNLAEGKVPLNEDKREIYELKRQLAEAREDIRILKKATALFIHDNPALR